MQRRTTTTKKDEERCLRVYKNSQNDGRDLLFLDDGYNDGVIAAGLRTHPPTSKQHDKQKQEKKEDFQYLKKNQCANISGVIGASV